MLFDLRSRGRRRTVQTVYLGLALLMGGGLVLFGVGAGNGFGGILNAFTGNGSSGAQSSALSSQEKAAIKLTQTRPNDAAAWSALVTAAWSTANQNSNLSTTGLPVFNSTGHSELVRTANAWQHYVALTKNPDPNVAILAARSLGYLSQYAPEAAAWEIFSGANATAPKGYECLAYAAYAAKQTRKGDLAAAKALSLLPKATAATLKLQINQAKTDPQFAQSC